MRGLLLAWSFCALLPGAAGAVPREDALRQAIERFVVERAPAPPTAVEVPPLADFLGADPVVPGSNLAAYSDTPLAKKLGIKAVRYLLIFPKATKLFTA